jgi:hypothetical protein
MADKKVKIDLKSRLGRAQSRPGEQPSSQPGVVPPPTGIAPPPGLLTPGGIPAPPFAAQRPAGPKVDAGDPFAAVSAHEAPAPRGPDIKVEIGHEVVQAQQKRFTAILGAAIGAAFVGGILGFVWGGMREKGQADTAAVKGAQEILSDVDKAQKEIKILGDKVDAANVSLFKNRKFPEGFSKELAGIVVPFDSSNLAGRNINRLKPQILRALFDFANDVQDLNKRKERLGRMFEANKADLVTLLEGAEHPRISYVVFVGKTKGNDPVATFGKIKSPFEFDKPWPEKVGILTGAEVVEAERYKTGEVFIKPPKTPKDKPTVYAVPIEPDGVAKAFPNDTGKRVEAEIATVVTLIKGTPSGTVTPGEEKDGLLKIADDLAKELKAVGGKR